MRTVAGPAITEPGVERSRARWLVLGSAGLLVGVTAVWGARLDSLGRGIGLHAPPLFAQASNRFGPRILLPIAVAIAVVWWGPALASRLRWRGVVAATAVAAAVWGVALALVDFGAEGLVRGLQGPFDLLSGVDRIAAPGPFLDSFIERIGDNVVHVRGHPPGLVLALWWLGRAGAGGAGPLAVVVIASGAAVVAATLIAVHELAGDALARRAAPFLVVSPAAIWLVSSADAIYGGLGAIGVAAVVLASGRDGPRSDVLAAIGGLVLGAGMFASYGLALLLVVPLAACVARRRLRPLVIVGLAMVGVGVAFAAAGFSWLDGLQATRGEYASSIAALRPYSYFVFANLAAFAIVLGPAPVAGMAALRDRRLWLFVAAALVAVVAADVSGLSKGEVERIWLPFWPWIAVAAASIEDRMRWWLAWQAALAIVVQTFLGTPW